MAAAAPAITYAELVREVADDWLAALESKRDVEQRRLLDYKLYRRFRSDVSNRGFDEAATGPFGWSKITVPLVYWIVETIVPRVATKPPELVVKPLSPEAVPYAQAKEMELHETVDAMRMRPTLHRALKQMVLYGDGPTKVTWDGVNRRPRFTSINWFDWFLSPDAATPETAEVIFHRTWYTPRQLKRLSQMTDRNGKPLYHGLDQVVLGETAEAADATRAERMEASGQGMSKWSPEGGLFCLVECWYEDGTVVVLGGSRGDRIVQIRTSPFRDEEGNPMRPFVVFSNSGDPNSPYSIGDAEMLEDHQHELSTLRNQAIDQTTVNLNAPVIYSGNIAPAAVNAAFGQPGGKLRVNGDVRTAVMRMAPGNVSADFYNFYDNVRGESQYISGVNDNVAGQASEGRQTAREVSIINDEANKRWQFKVAGVEDRMGEVGKLVDLLERRFGPPGRAIRVPKGRTIEEGQRGLMGVGGEALEPGLSTGGFARTSPFVNADGTRYSVSVKAGSLAIPSELEEFQKLAAVLELLNINPQIMENVDWREITRMIVAVSGYEPDRMLLSDDEIAKQQMVAALQAQLAAPAAAGGQPTQPAAMAA